MSLSCSMLLTRSNHEGVERVKKEAGGYAFLMESTTVEYIVERSCDLTQIGGLLDSKGYGIALPPNSPFRTPLSSAILQLQEGENVFLLKIAVDYFFYLFRILLNLFQRLQLFHIHTHPAVRCICCYTEKAPRSWISMIQPHWPFRAETRAISWTYLSIVGPSIKAKRSLVYIVNTDSTIKLNELGSSKKFGEHH